MSKLDDTIADSYTAAPKYRKQVLKNNIKKLILDLFKEAEYEPYAFVEKVEKL